MSKHVLRYEPPRLPTLMQFSIGLIFHSILWVIKRQTVKLYHKRFKHKPLRQTRLIILHHLHCIWWEVEGSWSWKETYFFPLLIKMSHQRLLHVLCQINDIISNQSHFSLYSLFTVLLLMWSQSFSGCHDREASCPPKDQKQLPKRTVIQGGPCECAQIPVTSGINNVLKIQKMFKVGKGGK